MTYQVGDRVILNSIPGVTYSPANVIPKHLLWDTHEDIGKEFTISKISLQFAGRTILSLDRTPDFDWMVYETDVSPVEDKPVYRDLDRIPYTEDLIESGDIDPVLRQEP